MFELMDGREMLYQWDVDRKVIVSDHTISEVHFCNGSGDCSLVVDVYEEGGYRVANVPNVLLQSDLPIRVYAYCGDGYTKRCETFKVIKRSKPSDYIYTETEIKRYEELEKRIEEVEKNSIPAETVARFVQKDDYGCIQTAWPRTSNDVAPAGYVNGFLPKNTEKSKGTRVYSVDNDGNQGMITVTGAAAVSSIPRRIDNGRLRVGDPVNDDEAATKKYVDNAVGGLTTLYWSNIQDDEYLLSTGEYLIAFCDENGDSSSGIYPTAGCLRIPSCVDSYVVGGAGEKDTMNIDNTGTEQGVIIGFNSMDLIGSYKVIKIRELPCPCGPVAWIIDVLF